MKKRGKVIKLKHHCQISTYVKEKKIKWRGENCQNNENTSELREKDCRLQNRQMPSYLCGEILELHNQEKTSKVT